MEPALGAGFQPATGSKQVVAGIRHAELSAP
jgi:hypothetical protein